MVQTLTHGFKQKAYVDIAVKNKPLYHEHLEVVALSQDSELTGLIPTLIETLLNTTLGARPTSPPF